jgi:hypothetical protein
MKEIKFGYSASAKEKEEILDLPDGTTSEEIEELYIDWLSEKTGGYWEEAEDENEN